MRVFIGVFIVLCVGAAAALGEWSPAVGELPSRSDAGWDARIAAIGAAAAYEEMAITFASADPNASHVEAHRFGDALYRVVGTSGFGICDDRFLYGCTHSFVARAIADQGEGVLQELHRRCDDSHHCEHGLGHGLVAHLGYEMHGVAAAADACLSLAPDHPFQGCVSGVFMEYYLRQMLDDIEERNMQILDASETAACDKFMSDVIPVCLFWRPQLIWERHQRIGGSRDDLVERIRTECATASDEMRLFCIGGAGQTAVSAGGYERSSVVGMCEALAADTREFVACVGTGARAIGGATSHERGVAVCEETFEDDERAECLIYLRSPGFGAVL